MSPLPFFGRGKFREVASQFTMATYDPELTLQGLTAGVDNLRPDVYLSDKLTSVARGHLKNLIEQFGDVQQLARVQDPNPFGASPYGRAHAKNDALNLVEIDYPAEFKEALRGIQLTALRRARAHEDIKQDLLLRVALLKFLRTELQQQFNVVLDLCREKLKGRDDHALERQHMAARDRFLKFQVNKRLVLRKVAEDVLSTMAEVERETVLSTRQSLFGTREAAAYEVLANRLIFPDSITDPFLRAEHYALFGSFDRDPDLFERVAAVAKSLYQDLGLASSNAEAESMLRVPENAKAIVYSGVSDDSPRGRAQKAITSAWVAALEEAGAMDYVVAAYEVVPILADYGQVVSPQQVKCALVQKSEQKTVEEILNSHDRRPLEKLHAAAHKVRSAGNEQRMRYASRYLIDLSRFYRDVCKMHVLESALEGVNLLTNARLRELSEINGTLYEYRLPEEEKPAERRAADHAVLKADVRDSSRLTRSMLERGLNPASFFSLNFFEPVNKLLPRYGAEKVFIEGDAIILAMHEAEGQRGFSVARSCVMGREMLNIVSAYNTASTEKGLPPLEIGIGIAYQSSAPVYLLDGSSRIMISEALNLSDRLSACHKRARRFMRDVRSQVNVIVFHPTEGDALVPPADDDTLINYNVGGIHLPRAAFEKLRDEISLEEVEYDLTMPWGVERVRFHRGLVPVGPGIFHPILVREAHVVQVDAADFRFLRWTGQLYYEVCTNLELLTVLGAEGGAQVPPRVTD